MRALIQRVKSASVSVDEKIISTIEYGYLVLFGIRRDDTQKDRDYIIKKIINLRLFSGKDTGKMDKSITDIGGHILVVSQFTLYANSRKGNRPSFIDAMPPEQAKLFYDNFISCLKRKYSKIKEGVFGAYMQIALINDGPVTILIDSAK